MKKKLNLNEIKRKCTIYNDILSRKQKKPTKKEIDKAIKAFDKWTNSLPKYRPLTKKEIEDRRTKEHSDPVNVDFELFDPLDRETFAKIENAKIIKAGINDSHSYRYYDYYFELDNGTIIYLSAHNAAYVFKKKAA